MEANREGGVERTTRKNDNKRVLSAKNNFEAAVYTRRHGSRSKRTSRTEGTQRDLSDNVTDDQDKMEESTYSWNKNRRHSHKLVKETETDADTTSKAKEKDLSNVGKEYHRLKKHRKRVQDECKKLRNLSEQREMEYQRLHSEYELLIEKIRDLEETKIDLLTRNEKLEREQIRSNEDIELLKNVVYQLNAELESYQDKLRDSEYRSKEGTVGESGLKATETEFEESRISAWGSVHFHALGPLLNAYQENFAEKRKLVAQYERAMAEFGGRCKEIVTENERLHKEVESLTSKCNRYTDEIKALVENAIALKKQNDLLLKDTGDRKREAREVHSTYEKKIESMLERDELLRKEHAANVKELSNLRGKYEVLSKEFQQVKNKEEKMMPIAVHDAAIDECRRLFDELKYRYEREKRDLTAEIRRIAETEPDNRKQFTMVVAERNHLKVLNKTFEKNCKRMQRKIDYLQRAVCSAQATGDSLKEQLNKALAYSEELFSEYEKIVAEREKLMALLRQTEKENANIDRLGKSITHRVDSLKNQLETVRRGTKRQVETVEQHLKVQESRVRQMKRKHRSKLRHLKKVISEKENIIGKLQNEKNDNRQKPKDANRSAVPDAL